MRSARHILLFCSCVLCACACIGQPGSFDHSFEVGTGFNGRVRALARTPDGRIYAGGEFTGYGYDLARNLVRLLASGERDTLLLVPDDVDSTVCALALQSDGRCIVGGDLTRYGGHISPRLLRVNEDGGFDAGFDIGAGFDSTVLALALTPAGDLLVAGRFTSCNGQPRSRLVRLHGDGSLDATFLQTGTGFNGTIISLCLRSDGRVLVGGDFTAYDGTPCGHIAQLGSDGTLDNAFICDPGFNTPVWCIAEQADQQFLAGGAFTTFNGSPTTRLVRFTADGIPDASFNAGTGPNNYVLTLAPMPNGMILGAGMFTQFNSYPRDRIVRLLEDGSVDDTFVTGGGFWGDGASTQVRALALEPDDRVLAGGLFHGYNNGTSQNLCRILNGQADAIPLLADPSAAKLITLPDGVSFVLAMRESQSVHVVDGTGRMIISLGEVHGPITLDLSVQPPGLYMVILRTAAGISCFTAVKP